MKENKKYIKFVKVDSITRKSSLEGPCKNGPDNPAVDGLEEDFWLESQAPTNTPIYYGYCNVDASLEVDGILEEISKDDYKKIYEKELSERFQRRKSELINSLTIKATEKKNALKSSVGDFDTFLMNVLCAKDFLYNDRKTVMQVLHNEKAEQEALNIENIFEDYCLKQIEIEKELAELTRNIKSSKTDKQLLKVINSLEK